jgi:hypothetical protein
MAGACLADVCLAGKHQSDPADHQYDMYEHEHADGHQALVEIQAGSEA